MNTEMMGFTQVLPTHGGGGDLMQVQSDRAVAEVQAAYVIAKKFPRDVQQSFLAIINSCKRPFLAEQAMYAYPRGNQTVTGPSIRLAEVLAQSWGNMDVGVRELSQANGESVAEAYAIDLQTNTRVTKVFKVPHIRYTKKGSTKLTDPRDIYELVANQGSRRMRACILAVIPGDVVEAAVSQCEKTLVEGKEPIADRIRKMVIQFDELGVKPSHLEQRLGHSLDATIPTELVKLIAIYKSLRDGQAKREDYFEMGAASDTNEKINDLINQKENTNLKPVPDHYKPVTMNQDDETKKKDLENDQTPINQIDSKNIEKISETGEAQTPEQMEEIEGLLAVKKIKKEQLLKLKDSFNVSDFKMLTQKQASELISQLNQFDER